MSRGEESVKTFSSRPRKLHEVEEYLGVEGLKIQVEPFPLGMYRYVWRLSWDANKRPLLIAGLMPSTADEEHADATVAMFHRDCEQPAPGGRGDDGIRRASGDEYVRQASDAKSQKSSRRPRFR